MTIQDRAEKRINSLQWILNGILKEKSVGNCDENTEKLYGSY